MAGSINQAIEWTTRRWQCDHNKHGGRGIYIAASAYLLPAKNCMSSKGSRAPNCETASFARSTRIQADTTAKRHASATDITVRMVSFHTLPCVTNRFAEVDARLGLDRRRGEWMATLMAVFRVGCACRSAAENHPYSGSQVRQEICCLLSRTCRIDHGARISSESYAGIVAILYE